MVRNVAAPPSLPHSLSPVPYFSGFPWCGFILRFSSLYQDRLALMELPPAPVPSSPHPCDEVYLTPLMVERALCAVLKQVNAFNKGVFVPLDLFVSNIP